jgi:uncharacterized protein (TIRG00374 family)
LAAVALALTFRSVDPSAVAVLLGRIHPGMLTALLLPQLVGIALDTLGWSCALRTLSTPVKFLPLLGVRLSSEALAQSLPGGAVISETSKPVLLARRCHLALADGVAAVAGRKYLLLLAHAGYLLLALAIGLPHLRVVSRGLFATDVLVWAVLLAAVALLLAARALRIGLSRGNIAARVLAALQRLPIRRWQAALRGREASFTTVDCRVEGSFRVPLCRFAPALLAFLAGWCVEALETYLLLRALGVELPFAAVLGVEVVASFLRSAVFVLPAGLGVQDLGYYALLAALGVDDALTAAAAFSLLKRLKELFWIAVGYSLLLTSTRPRIVPRPLLRAG